MTTAVAFGTFDLFHPGHIAFLKEARQLCDRLVVIVAKDAVVLHYKHRLPVRNEQTRLADVALCEFVDEAVLGDSLEDQGTFRVLARLKPDLVTLGYDQEELKNALKSHEVFRNTLKTVTLDPFNPDIYKTSLLRRDDSV